MKNSSVGGMFGRNDCLPLTRLIVMLATCLFDSNVMHTDSKGCCTVILMTEWSHLLILCLMFSGSGWRSRSVRRQDVATTGVRDGGKEEGTREIITRSFIAIVHPYVCVCERKCVHSDFLKETFWICDSDNKIKSWSDQCVEFCCADSVLTLL